MNPRAIKQGGFKRKMVKKEWVNRLDGHEWRDNQNRRRHDVKTIKIRLHGCKRWIFFFVTWFNFVGTTHFSFQWWLHFFLFLMASFVEWYSFFKGLQKDTPVGLRLVVELVFYSPHVGDYGIVVSSFQIYNLFWKT